MVDISKLLCGAVTPGDPLRYSASSHRRPVVVWNLTRRCNLHCAHCYASAGEGEFPGEFIPGEALGVIDQLAEFGVPVVLFSGGEPLLREDLLELVRRVVQRGMRAVISTNGTLLTRPLALRLKEAGISYVGVSLDGMEAAHDRFRGKRGAFREALAGLGYCREARVRTGVRFTLTRFNRLEVPALFDLLEAEGLDRLCFYHLVYAGRGSQLISWDLSSPERRETVDLIFERTRDYFRRGLDKDILTVDNHTDGVYLYLKVRDGEPERAEEVFRLLRRNGGNSSGEGIAAIDNLGYVHPDQFWYHYNLGNIRERSFAQIWQDPAEPLLVGLRQREGKVKGRCARCHHFGLCRGNFRVRAEAFYGDLWAPDPACYLTDQEIGIDSDAPS